MTKYKVLGYRKFQSKKNSINYISLYLTYKDQNVMGMATENVLCKSENVEDATENGIQIGKTEAQVYYTKGGYVDTVLLTDPRDSQ